MSKTSINKGIDFSFYTDNETGKEYLMIEVFNYQGGKALSNEPSKRFFIDINNAENTLQQNLAMVRDQIEFMEVYGDDLNKEHIRLFTESVANKYKRSLARVNDPKKIPPDPKQPGSGGGNTPSGTPGAAKKRIPISTNADGYYEQRRAA